MNRFSALISLLLLVSCGRGQFSSCPEADSARWLETGDSLIVSISPFDGSRDTLVLDRPLRSIACMSSSFAAAFAEIGAADCVCAVSGLRYMSNPYIRENACELGSDASLDYETLLRLKPDLLLAYSVGSALPLYINKVRSLGVKVLVLYDHLETTPLARASYMRACGLICGRREEADSVYAQVSASYAALRDSVERRGGEPCPVLINSPYGDAWYVPGRDSYMYRIVKDAGGEILGAREGVSSSTISLEQAFVLGRKAKIWLNPGSGELPEQISIEEKWDNTLRTTPQGGNDFWERGAVRPDLILSDLAAIFSGDCQAPMNFYLRK